MAKSIAAHALCIVFVCIFYCGAREMESQHHPMLISPPHRSPRSPSVGYEGSRGGGNTRRKSLRCYKEKVSHGDGRKVVESRMREERISSTFGDHPVSTSGFDKDKDCSVRTWEGNDGGSGRKDFHYEKKGGQGSSYGYWRGGEGGSKDGGGYRRTYTYSHEYPQRKHQKGGREEGGGRRWNEGREGGGRSKGGKKWQSPKYSQDLTFENRGSSHLHREKGGEAEEAGRGTQGSVGKGWGSGCPPLGHIPSTAVLLLVVAAMHAAQYGVFS